jgi:hypothetical protein
LRRARAALLAAVLFLAVLPRGAAAFERVGPWSFGSWYGVGFPAANDINNQVDLANLAFSSDITPFESNHEATGDLRRELSKKLAAEMRAGYWWKRRGEGLYTRRISAIPLELGVIYTALSSRRFRAGFTGAGGVLFDATYAGEDPLGGVNTSGTGTIGELGLTGEIALSEAWSMQGRVVGRYAVARHVLPDNGDLDFSGISLGIGLRVSFDTRPLGEAPADSTEKK